MSVTPLHKPTPSTQLLQLPGWHTQHNTTQHNTAQQDTTQHNTTRLSSSMEQLSEPRVCDDIIHDAVAHSTYRVGASGRKLSRVKMAEE